MWLVNCWRRSKRSSETERSRGADVVSLAEADLVEGLLQVRRPHALGHVSVGRVGEEELPLCSQSGANVLPPVDVFLAAVDHADVACATRRGESAQPQQMPHTGDLLAQLAPRRSGSSLFSKMSLASVPSSIRSSFVITPMVRKPERMMEIPSPLHDSRPPWLTTKQTLAGGDLNGRFNDHYPAGRPPWRSSERPSWPGRCWRA